jgi:hypothetical protein
MVCVKTDGTVHLTVGKRYHILDLSPSSIVPGEPAEFDYLVYNDRHEYLWASSQYFSDFVINDKI